MRKSSGWYWTVQYIDDNGLFYNVGSFATREEALHDIIVNTSNYPVGEGKVIHTR